MVDYFSLAITHGLLALAALRLILRADLDRDPVPAADSGADSTTPPAGSAKGRKAARRA